MTKFILYISAGSGLPRDARKANLPVHQCRERIETSADKVTIARGSALTNQISLYISAGSGLKLFEKLSPVHISLYISAGSGFETF